MNETRTYGAPSSAHGTSAKNAVRIRETPSRISWFATMAAIVLLIVSLSMPSALALSAETALAIDDKEFSLKVGEVCASPQVAGKPNKGVVLVGSSSFGRWSTADIDIASLHQELSPELISNYSIGGSKSRQWVSSRYVNAIMAKQPRVIVIYGANSIVRSPKSANKSSKLVAQSFFETRTFIKKCRERAKKARIKSPKFILMSIVKAPKYYLVSKPTKKSCVIWNRFDAYNRKLKKYAKTHSDTSYCTIEKYYYHKDKQGKLRYYAHTAGGGKTVSASTVLKNYNACPFFEEDGVHPTVRAYQQIWKRISNAIVKVM